MKNNENLRHIMLGGTGSDVGKSMLAAGICRLLRQDGFNPAPFKAQNMALNSYVTVDGLEIGRAQAVQAEAAGVECTAEMNPVLLKPTGDMTSQVVLMGKPLGNRSAAEYFRKEGKAELRKMVNDAFDRLADQYSPIVMEGAGSITELNLRATDIVNMPMAAHADAAVILVADIDRGGVFASAYGSIMLQNPEDRKRIKGIIINKFRGDINLFKDGRKMLEEICGVPVLGVVPYTRDIHIEEEDSVSLLKKNTRHTEENLINVAALAIPHLSNFTDFDTLARDPRVHLYFTDEPRELNFADVVILPGSKNTIADLEHIRQRGCVEAIHNCIARNSLVIGICGGYQMLGQSIADPEGVEGECRLTEGIGLLPVRTSLTKEKITRRTIFRMLESGEKGTGYEVHMGETTLENNAIPLTLTDRGDEEGCIVAGTAIGTYIHGFFDNTEIIDYILRPFAERRGLPIKSGIKSYSVYKEEQYDALADLLRKSLNVPLLHSIIRRDIP